jgi:chlorite dismutase
MEPVVPSTGWGVTHLFFRVHPSRSPDPAQAGKELVAALDSFAAEYLETEDDIRHRLAAQGVEDLEDRVARAVERLATQRQDRLHPRLPRRAVLAFYPMSKARDPGANWYKLPFERRRELMHGHGKVGRRYTGRVLQLVTGSTGLDDFEWGVTLLADDLSAIKDVVYDMRFDEVTASYGRFGPFLVGLTCTPAELPARLGLE